MRKHKLHRHSKTGFMGVTRTPKGHFWARIYMLGYGKYKYLGCYHTAEEASKAYEKAMKKEKQ